MRKKLRNRIILGVGLVTAIAIIAVGYLPKANSFSGFKGKTLWDWLSLLVVPASLAGLGALLQMKEQQIAEDNRQEEALQHYLDRVSNLVIEKNLLAIAAKDAPTTEEKELLKVSLEIIRALTLSTLRLLSKGSRKTSLFRFLLEADIIKQLKVSLKGADLSGADLSDTKLEYVDFRNANFSGASLWAAYLPGAYLMGADFTNADLTHASLSGAKLMGADFTNADLTHADLSGAKLAVANLTNADLTQANLSGANFINDDARGLTKKQIEGASFLCKTKLPDEIDIDPDRDCSRMTEFFDMLEWKFPYQDDE
jgi:uncharacterized protein YjbI with pentapeptide repeats